MATLKEKKEEEVADLASGILRSESFAPQQVNLVPFPTAAYTRNVFYSGVLYGLTLLFVMGA